MAAMYAVYHGPVGLLQIAHKVHFFTQVLKAQIERVGCTVLNSNSYFDTLTVDVRNVIGSAHEVHRRAAIAGINLRQVDDSVIGVTLDESVSSEDLVKLINVFATASNAMPTDLTSLISNTLDISAPTSPHVYPVAPSDLSPHYRSHISRTSSGVPADLRRTSEFLPHSVFNTHHSESEMLRYIHQLQARDLSLVHAMIPLGSCTMKLNSTSSMIPLTWPEFGGVHPFAPKEQVEGYRQIIKVGCLSAHICFSIDWLSVSSRN